MIVIKQNYCTSLDFYLLITRNNMEYFFKLEIK